MEKQLISITDIVKKGWKLYIQNFKIFLMPIGILLLPYIALLLLEQLKTGPVLIIILFVLAIIIFVNLWIAIFFIELINNIYNKKTVSLNKIYESSFQKIPSYLWVSILAALAALGGLILLIIPGIIFIVWYNFAPFINILENKNNKGVNALKSSRQLIKGRWGATFFRLLIPSLFIYLIVIIIVAILSYLLTQTLPWYIELDLLANYISTAVFIILSPLFTAFMIVLYNSLVKTKTKVV